MIRRHDCPAAKGRQMKRSPPPPVKGNCRLFCNRSTGGALLTGTPGGSPPPRPEKAKRRGALPTWAGGPDARARWKNLPGCHITGNWACRHPDSGPGCPRRQCSDLRDSGNAARNSRGSRPFDREPPFWCKAGGKGPNRLSRGSNRKPKTHPRCKARRQPKGRPHRRRRHCRATRRPRRC